MKTILNLRHRFCRWAAVFLSAVLLILYASGPAALHVHASLAHAICPSCGRDGDMFIEDSSMNAEFGPTCTESGRYRFECFYCNYVWYEANPNEPALGHTYSSAMTVTQAATCGAAGEKSHTCDRCGFVEREAIPATGNHSYTSSVTTPATCTAAGVTTFRCTVCGTSYTQAAPAATGHHYQPAVTREATCGADGVLTYTCVYCGSAYTEAIPATGDHQYEEEITTPATCVDAGVKTFTCSVCGDSYTEEIEATGEHEFPDEWTIEREATAEKEGLQVKVCAVCGERLEEEIPKLEESSEETEDSSEDTSEDTSEESSESEEASDTSASEETDGSETETEGEGKGGIPRFFERLWSKVGSAFRAFGENKTAVWIAAAAGVLLIGGLVFLLVRLQLARAAAEAAAGAGSSGLGELPKLEDKIILTYFGESKFNKQLLETLKGKSYLSVVAVDAPSEDLLTSIRDEDPDLIIFGVENAGVFEAREKEIIGIKGALKDDARIAIVADFVSARELKPRYEEMVKSERIVSWHTDDLTVNTVMNRLILPLYKPELTLENTAGYIGKIADVLGIPGISFITNLYVNGKDIKETAELSEKGFAEKATIIADIASILGLDTVASVVGLVNDVDDIRTALDSEAGANEEKAGRNAVKDIKEVVEDLFH